MNNNRLARRLPSSTKLTCSKQPSNTPTSFKSTRKNRSTSLATFCWWKWN